MLMMPFGVRKIRPAAECWSAGKAGLFLLSHCDAPYLSRLPYPWHPRVNDLVCTSMALPYTQIYLQVQAYPTFHVARIDCLCVSRHVILPGHERSAFGLRNRSCLVPLRNGRLHKYCYLLPCLPTASIEYCKSLHLIFSDGVWYMREVHHLEQVKSY